MKKLLFIISTILVFAVSCTNDDPAEPEAKRQTIYDTTRVKYTDSIFHHFYDTLAVYDTVRVPILCDHSWVVYVLDASKKETDSVEIKNGTSIKLKSDATRFGYDFVQWSTEKTGAGNTYKAGDSYYVDKDITLYAIWQSHDGLHDYEVYDYLASKENGSTVDVKIIDINPDFEKIDNALKKFWKVNVNLDLSDATGVTDLSLYNTNIVSISFPPNIIDLDVELNKTSLIVPTGVKNLSFSGDNLTIVSIPETVESLIIRRCPKLESINIPNSVSKLSLSGSISKPIGLKTLSIPNSVKEITDITYCTSITEITIPESVENMYMIFEGCTNLKTVKHNLKECSGAKFDGCQKLISITLPEFRPEYSIVEDNISFYNCSSLTSINIPEGVISIKASAFWYCSSLTSIIIPESVTSIGANAFYGCSSLTSATIPKNVTSIGGSAFNACESLTSLKIESTTPPTLPDYLYWIGDGLGTIYVPSSSVNAYKTADVWKDHADQIVGY